MPDEKPPKIGIVESVRKRVSNILPRASWALTPDRKRLATKDIQEKTKRELSEILAATLADPEAMADLGLSAPAVAAGPSPGVAKEPELDAIDVAQLALEGVSRGAIYAGIRAGYATKHAAVLGLSDTERAKLAPLTAKVIEKYLPPTLGTYGEEIALAVALTGLVVAKVQLLREVSAKDITPQAVA